MRKRIANYDIEYFYDVAVSTEKRKKLSGVEDLCKLDDSELIQGAKEIDMISDVGYNHLDYIKYMRNWASAAHPNQTELTGLQLISWLETCIKEVINLPNSTVTIETGRFLKNLKEKAFSNEEVQAFTSFVGNLTTEKVNNLAAGLFGIYYRSETEVYVRDNVKQVFPLIWERISEDTKNEFGIKYARFAVNGDVTEAQNARELLEMVDGQAYFPEEIRVTELGNAIDQLNDAHNGLNNFYREPTFALQLKRVAGKKEIPRRYIIEEFASDVVSIVNYFYRMSYYSDATYSAGLQIPTVDQIESELSKTKIGMYAAEVDFSTIIQILEQKLQKLMDFTHPRAVWHILNLISSIKDA